MLKVFEDVLAFISRAEAETQPFLPKTRHQTVEQAICSKLMHGNLIMHQCEAQNGSARR